MKFLAGVLLIGLAACGIGNFSPTNNKTNEDYDGSWNVEVQIDACYSFTGVSSIVVSNQSFSATLLSYCANVRDGATRLAPSTGCVSGEVEETVSVTGTFDGDRVDGNMFLTGGSCQGGNGYEGFVQNDNATAGSAWGSLTLVKVK